MEKVPEQGGTEVVRIASGALSPPMVAGRTGKSITVGLSPFAPAKSDDHLPAKPWPPAAGL